MPEQLTKYPDVTMEVLRSAGAKCGVGAEQEILRACPRERFCKLPGGEMCVYGLADASEMTQITRADWRTVMESLEAPDRTSGAPTPAQPELIGSAGLLIGLAVGVVVARKRAASRRPP